MALDMSIIAFPLFLGGVWLYMRTRHGTRRSFSRHCEMLMDRLQEATHKAHEIDALLAHVRDDHLADYYENALSQLEHLLRVIREIPTMERDGISLKAALYLGDVCVDRMSRIRKAFEVTGQGGGELDDEAKEAQVALLLDWKIHEEGAIKGCYFCSKPHLDGFFELARIHMEGKTLKVVACQSCAVLLKGRQKVKVLHFRKDGRTVHWSEVKEYLPSRDYWTLCHKRLFYQRPRLSLLSSEKDLNN